MLKRRLISKVISDEKIHVLLISLLLGSHVVLAENSLNALSQEALYKNWLVSRCIGKSTDLVKTKQDAFRSAAYLELSKLPMDAFEQGEKLAEQYANKNSQGSVQGTYHTLDCLSLQSASEANVIFLATLISKLVIRG
ncbi:type VI secretion system amidase immunity protein Tai4 [Serratia ureilytica]